MNNSQYINQYKAPNPQDSNLHLFEILVGSLNYDLVNENSDKDYKTFVLPNKNDIYFGRRANMVSLSAELDNEYKDVRDFAEALFKSNPAYLEMLFSKEINILVKEPLKIKKVKEFLDFFISQREEIVTFNLPKLWSSSYGTMSKLGKEYLSSENHKKIYHIVRIVDLLEKYENNSFKNYGSLLVPNIETKKLLMNIKEKKYNHEELIKFLNNALLTMKNLEKSYKKIDNTCDKEYSKYILKTMDLMDLNYLTFPFEDQPKINEDLKLKYSYHFEKTI